MSPLKKCWVLLLAASACTRLPAGNVVLGAAGPWQEGYGAANKNGIELAVEEINASPQWAGARRRLAIEFADDSGQGVAASTIAQRFVNDPRIVAVIGHVNSGAMVSAAHVYDRHLAAVATTATSPILTGISSWAFRLVSSDSANGLAVARFADHLGHKRAAVLYENNPYGRGLAENFLKGFPGTIVAVDPIAEGDGEPLEPFVTWYKRSRPDVVFVAGTGASGLAFLKEARRQQLTPDLIGGDGWQDLARNPLAEGVHVAAPFTAQDPRPEVRTFVAAYRRKFNATPDGNAALAYDATKLLAAVVAKVGTNRQRIRDYLAGLSTTGGYRGVTGDIRFGADGDPIGRAMTMMRDRQGVLQVESSQ